MDIISYAKAGQALKGAQKYDNNTVGIGAEDRFDTVDERIDYLENKLTGRYEERVTKIDLSKGTFINTELNEFGKLNLKVLDKLLTANNSKEYTPGTTDEIKGFTVEIGSPVIGSNYSVDKLFNKQISADTDRYVGASAYPNIFIFNNTVPIVLDKYMMISMIYSLGGPKDWTVQGSNDKEHWDIIHTVINNPKMTSWTTFETQIKAPYLYHRFVFTSNNGYSGYGASIDEMRLFTGNVFIYVDNGYWESDIIDLGGDWVETKNIEILDSIASNQSVVIQIAYSDDGVTFTPYELYDAASLKQHRFIKFKIELASSDSISSSKEYDYSHEENNDFSFNKDVVTQSNSITLNTSIIKDSTLKQEGIYETDISNISNIFSIKEVF